MLEASPELRQALDRRLRLLEGCTPRQVSGSAVSPANQKYCSGQKRLVLTPTGTPRLTAAALRERYQSAGVASSASGSPKSPGNASSPSHGGQLFSLARRTGTEFVPMPLVNSPPSAKIGSDILSRQEEIKRRATEMKERLLRGGPGAPSAKERNRMLEEADELLAQADSATQLHIGRLVRDMAPAGPEARARTSFLQGGLSPGVHEAKSPRYGLAAEAEILRAESERLRREYWGSSLLAEVETVRKDRDRERSEHNTLKKQHADLARRMHELQEPERNTMEQQLVSENSRLRAELSACKQQIEHATKPIRQQEDGNPEQRLRAVFTDQQSSTEDLRSAIGGVEALVTEARRELAAREFREKRAAHEDLYKAINAAQEDHLAEPQLAEAVTHAQLARVDAEDIAKAEAQLAELRAMTLEERAAKAAKKLEAERKERVFLMVKRNEAIPLKELLTAMDAEMAAGKPSRWREWARAGRTLWQAAQEPERAEAKAVLSELLFQRKICSMDSPESVEESPAACSPARAEAAAAAWHVSTPATTRFVTPEKQSVCSALMTPLSDRPFASPQSSRIPIPSLVDLGCDSPRSRLPGTPRPLMGQGTPPHKSEKPRPATATADTDPDMVRRRSQAFRAVVQNDVDSLDEVMAAVPKEVWIEWKNKAGVDLLTLSEERGANNTYSSLAHALGFVTEMAREPFEERETVWVFFPGEVMPRRASVMEDTLAAADEVLVEYWEGNDPAQPVPRCLVRKSA